jgi:outer membrane protein TolC
MILRPNPEASDYPPLDPWWQPLVPQPVRQPDALLPITLEELVVRTIQHSSRIRTISDSPLIRETAIIQADAEFDWAGFMETRWDDISEPVGNTLTTGGPTRFNEHRWDYRYGVRRKNHYGGLFEIDQRYGYLNNNSVFTDPNPQRTSRLTLSYTQPLLRGAGRVYNTSLIMVAQIETGIAYDAFSRQLQEQLLEVANAYWNLYLHRGSLLQKHRSYQRAATILSDLEHRRMIDAVTSQVVRAESETAARRSDLVRAQTMVKNSESRLRMLINDPALGTVDQFELAPLDVPTTDYIPVDMQGSLTTAIQNRPEIAVSMKRIRAAAVRLRMSKNELLPVLDLVLESYVNGINANDIGGAVGDQYSEGAPTYAVGLEMEYPFCNRRARAVHQQRQLEVRQLRNELQLTVETLSAEVEVAVREVITSFREMHARFKAMEAAAKDVAYIERRWKLLPGAEEGAILLLEDLLTSQDRLANEEYNFLRAQVDYSFSMIELKRVIGTLLQHEQIVPTRMTDGCLPMLQVTKQLPYVQRESLPPAREAEGAIRPLPPLPAPEMPGDGGHGKTENGQPPPEAEDGESR